MFSSAAKIFRSSSLDLSSAGNNILLSFLNKSCATSLLVIIVMVKRSVGHGDFWIRCYQHQVIREFIQLAKHKQLWTRYFWHFFIFRFPIYFLSSLLRNLLLAKQVHHLLGLPSAVSNTFSHTLWPGESKMNEVNNSLYFLLTCFMSQLQKILSNEIRLFSGGWFGINRV